jgi:hypothetical protein
MNRESLKRLAVLLEGCRDSDVTRFDLQNWGKFEDRRAGFLWLQQHPCNTAACAVGLACGSGIFAEDGLSYEVDEITKELTPLFRNLEGWSAVRAFFDLDQVQAVELFAGHSYAMTEGEVAARAVAARIRKMIAPLDESIQTPRER